MRRAYNGKIWRDDRLDVIAVNLGSDFCAEHEWGISGIKNRFGIDSNKTGIDSRKITKGNESILGFSLNVETYSDRKKGAKEMFGLGMVNKYTFSKEDPIEEFKYYSKGSYFDPQKEEVISFWAESRFMFLLESERDANDFIEAFKKNDIAIWTGSAGPFRNGGLVIAIVSRLPEEFKKEILEYDLDYTALKNAASSTGIHSILENVGLSYYSLSPKWKDDSKKEVVFWLNPHSQNLYKSGWYGVEELKQWAEGKGPIIKEKAKV